MKRLLTTAVILPLLFGATGFSRLGAQDKNTDDFHGHWYIQVQGGIGQTVGETSFGSLISPAAAFNFGYRFTPVWGLRAGISGWQGKGAVLGPTETYRYSYLQGNVDVTVDICSIFAGYRQSRAVSPYLFAGAGLNGGFNNGEAQALAAQFPADNLLWDGSLVCPAGRFGVGTGIRITDAVQFNVEVNGNFLSDRFNSKRGSAVDWQLGAVAGFTFNIGLKKHKASRQGAPASVPAVPASSSTTESSPAAAEPVPSTPAPAEAPSTAPATEPGQDKVVEVTHSATAAPVVKEQKRDIYFKIGRYELREQEIVKLEEIAALAAEHPEATVEITGYADPQTGTAERNMYLSKERAEAVAVWLESKGISRERLKVSYRGSEESPYGTPEENRVAVCVIR